MVAVASPLPRGPVPIPGRAAQVGDRPERAATPLTTALARRLRAQGSARRDPCRPLLPRCPSATRLSVLHGSHSPRAHLALRGPAARLAEWRSADESRRSPSVGRRRKTEARAGPARVHDRARDSCYERRASLCWPVGGVNGRGPATWVPRDRGGTAARVREPCVGVRVRTGVASPLCDGLVQFVCIAVSRSRPTLPRRSAERL